nr:hypothetical protein [uncultured Sphaerochaeta sp.]
MLSYETYLSALGEKLSSQFDLSSEEVIDNYSYDLFGTMNIRNSKYMLSEKVQIYGYENNEFLWIRKQDGGDCLSLKNELDRMKKEIPRLVEPQRDHMSSLLTLLLVTEGDIPSEWARLARRFRYQKGFALGFRGWADLILVILSLGENRVVTHRHFMKTAAFFLPEKICPKERT